MEQPFTPQELAQVIHDTAGVLLIGLLVAAAYVQLPIFAKLFTQKALKIVWSDHGTSMCLFQATLVARWLKSQDNCHYVTVSVNTDSVSLCLQTSDFWSPYIWPWLLMPFTHTPSLITAIRRCWTTEYGELPSQHLENKLASHTTFTNRTFVVRNINSCSSPFAQWHLNSTTRFRLCQRYNTCNTNKFEILT